MLFQFISYLTGGDRKKKAKKALADGLDCRTRDAAALDVAGGVAKVFGHSSRPGSFHRIPRRAAAARFITISSSLKCAIKAAFLVDGRKCGTLRRRKACASRRGLDRPPDRVSPGDRIRVYVQKAQHFALPADPNVPIIMVGPGNGVAPFRAFLQERIATKAPGRNWLYFGHQRSDYDFFYQDEFVAMRSAGHLNRLTLAWSRDGDEKIYVQHRMRDDGRDLWDWLSHGAHIYVCGRYFAHGKRRRSRAD